VFFKAQLSGLLALQAVSFAVQKAPGAEIGVSTPSNEGWVAVHKPQCVIPPQSQAASDLVTETLFNLPWFWYHTEESPDVGHGHKAFGNSNEAQVREPIKCCGGVDALDGDLDWGRLSGLRREDIGAILLH